MFYYQKYATDKYWWGGGNKIINVLILFLDLLHKKLPRDINARITILLLNIFISLAFENSPSPVHY